jgi:hypothetical protein
MRDRLCRAAALGKYLPPDLQDAAGPQFFHLRVADAEVAEDIGIVLAQLRGDRAHPHPYADPDRGAEVRNLAKLRVAGVLDQTTVAHLRVRRTSMSNCRSGRRYARCLEYLDIMLS